MMPLDYPHPAELEQRGGLHYKPFRPLRLTTFFLIQPLTRAILFYLASNPRSRVKPNGDLLWTGFAAGLFPKHPPELYIGDLGGHLLPDLFDRGPFAVDFLAHIVPVYILIPTAVLARRLHRRL